MFALCELTDKSDGPWLLEDRRTHYTQAMCYTSDTVPRQAGFFPVPLTLIIEEPDLYL